MRINKLYLTSSSSLHAALLCPYLRPTLSVLFPLHSVEAHSNEYRMRYEWGTTEVRTGPEENAGIDSIFPLIFVFLCYKSFFTNEKS